jgi:hypothetical protein
MVPPAVTHRNNLKFQIYVQAEQRRPDDRRQETGREITGRKRPGQKAPRGPENHEILIAVAILPDSGRLRAAFVLSD